MSQLVISTSIPAPRPVDQQGGNQLFNQSDSIGLIFKHIQDRSPLPLINKATNRVSQAILKRSFKQLQQDSRTKDFQKRHPTLSSFIRANQISNHHQLVTHLRKEAQDLGLTETKEYQAFKTSTTSTYLLSLDALIEKENFDRADQDERLWSLLSLIELPEIRNYQTWNEAVQAIDVSGITSLDLTSSALTRIPYGIFQLQNLQFLNLSRNKLIALPRAIGNLYALTTLVLNCNQLTALPSEIGLLYALSALTLDRNQLTTLPREIGMLENLQILHLAINSLVALPQELSQLQNLSELNLKSNQLTSLPESFERLVSRLTYRPEKSEVRKLVEEGRMPKKKKARISWGS